MQDNINKLFDDLQKETEIKLQVKNEFKKLHKKFKGGGQNLNKKQYLIKHIIKSLSKRGQKELYSFLDNYKFNRSNFNEYIFGKSNEYTILIKNGIITEQHGLPQNRWKDFILEYSNKNNFKKHIEYIAYKNEIQELKDITNKLKSFDKLFEWLIHNKPSLIKDYISITAKEKGNLSCYSIASSYVKNNLSSIYNRLEELNSPNPECYCNMRGLTSNIIKTVIGKNFNHYNIYLKELSNPLILKVNNEQVCQICFNTKFYGTSNIKLDNSSKTLKYLNNIGALYRKLEKQGTLNLEVLLNFNILISLDLIIKIVIEEALNKTSCNYFSLC